MSKGEQIYLFVVLGVFVGFGLWLAYNSWRFDRLQRSRHDANAPRPDMQLSDRVHA